MTTAIYIYYTPSWQPLADIVLPIAARYCERWGYAKEFVCEDVESLSLRKIEYGGNQRPTIDFYKMPIGYWKMAKLRELLDKYDLIFVLDCDAMITNEGVKFEDYVTPGVQQMWFTHDTNGLNAGSWIVKSTPWTKDILDMVIEDFFAPEEQTVIKLKISQFDPAAVGILPHPSINSYLYTEYLNDWAAKVGDVPMPTHEGGMWQPGDFILHLPGLTLDRRIEIFNMIKEQV